MKGKDDVMRKGTRIGRMSCDYQKDRKSLCGIDPGNSFFLNGLIHVVCPEITVKIIR